MTLISRAPFESPAQLAVIGIVVWLLGVVIHPLALLVPIGLVALAIAGLAYVLRPRRQTMYWRGRRIELDDAPGLGTQVYRRLFRR